jgi:hypothetical protein
VLVTGRYDLTCLLKAFFQLAQLAGKYIGIRPVSRWNLFEASDGVQASEADFSEDLLQQIHRITGDAPSRTHLSKISL